MHQLVAKFYLGALVLFVGNFQLSRSDQERSRHLAQDHRQGHADGLNVQPVPFAYCKTFLERLSHHDQHQLRESYQHYHGAYAKFIRASRNHEAFSKGPATWLQDESQKQAWNLTYLWGNNGTELKAVMNDAQTVKDTMEQRIKAQLDRLTAQGNLPSGTAIDDLSPCIMRKIYPSHFPDQPAVSLLLRIRGAPANPGDWPPPSNDTTKEPPTGKGPEVVAAFLARAMECRKVTPLELVVALSGQAATAQATTWAWQSWQTDGFVVPLLDFVDREAHVLNRLASVARGSLVVALRIDRPGVEDLLTGPDCSWLQHIVTLYHRIPQLGGMTHGRYSFSHPATAEGALRVLGPGGTGGTSGNQFFKEKMTSVPFQYVLYGDYMPISFRRSALEEVGGFDEDLPQGDEPCSSLSRRDVSLRLWKSGWRVGAHDAGMLQPPQPPADPTNAADPSRCTPQVADLATRLFNDRHAPSVGASSSGGAASGAPMEVLMARVKELNLKELDPLTAQSLSPCPMPQGCTP